MDEKTKQKVKYSLHFFIEQCQTWRSKIMQTDNNKSVNGRVRWPLLAKIVNATGKNQTSDKKVKPTA